MRILSWCMDTRVVDLLILLIRSSWMIIISWTNPHCSWRRVFFQIHLKLGQSHSPPFVCMQTRCDDLQLSLRPKCFMGLLPVSLLLDDPPCDEFQLPLSL
jgi:hypothetical protein